MINKNLLLESVQNDSAKFIKEEWIIKDCWKLTYEFNGIKFGVNAYGYERWLEENPEMIEIYE